MALLCFRFSSCMIFLWPPPPPTSFLLLSSSHSTVLPSLPIILSLSHSPLPSYLPSTTYCIHTPPPRRPPALPTCDAGGVSCRLQPVLSCLALPPLLTPCYFSAFARSFVRACACSVPLSLTLIMHPIYLPLRSSRSRFRDVGGVPPSSLPFLPTYPKHIHFSLRLSLPASPPHLRFPLLAYCRVTSDRVPGSALHDTDGRGRASFAAPLSSFLPPHGLPPAFVRPLRTSMYVLPPRLPTTSALITYVRTFLSSLPLWDVRLHRLRTCTFLSPLALRRRVPYPTSPKARRETREAKEKIFTDGGGRKDVS
ncbi:hypothetical protein R3P38DRAFT_243533 [Favolaschia claudopus]|uniref:Uncharacterized protein n=1 Tax=Favolaschia claudopus TaxID=2862362 RepID=A0AAW0CXM0_9AGAR